MLKLFLILVSVLCSGLFFGSCSEGEIDPSGSSSPSEVEETADKADRMEWFSDAKFGMFIHWGPYSNLGGEWNGKKVGNDRISEWIMNYLEIPRDEYRRLARDFNPVDFSAGEWVGLAREAGMKYLVFTAKHHDGFAMYDSKVSDYNIRDWTPFAGDPFRELGAECRENDIRLGFYYSQREDWDEPFAYGNTWDFDFNPEQALDIFEKKYLETKAKPQLRELLTDFGTVDLIWFDRGLYTQDQARDLRELVGSLQPDCLVNGRIGNYNSELMGDFQELNDNGMPASGIEEYWESPQTLNDTWGYSKFDHNWKSSGEVIRRLVEIVSKGGNYLLNIGPDGLGRIPEPSREILRETGRWMKLYGESIYGTKASPLEAADWGFCTRKGNALYLHITDWPKDGRIVLKGLLNSIKTAVPLSEPEKKLEISRDGEFSVLDITSAAKDKYVTVLKLELEGAPRVSEPVVSLSADNTYLLNYESAITGGRAVKRYNRKGGYHISGWLSPDDSISWNLNVDEPGRYRVSVSYAALPSWAGQEFRIKAGETALVFETAGTGDWYDFKTFDLGIVNLDDQEGMFLEIRPGGWIGEKLMYFREILLEPIEQN